MSSWNEFFGHQIKFVNAFTRGIKYISKLRDVTIFSIQASSYSFFRLIILSIHLLLQVLMLVGTITPAVIESFEKQMLGTMVQTFLIAFVGLNLYNDHG